MPSAGTETYTVAANSNRLTSIAGAVNRSFTYAASGQAATDQRSPVSAWSYTTDKAGRMQAAVLNSVTQATFAYDDNELRIANTNSLTSAITHYVYDADGQLIAEMNGATGAVIREYLWLGALPIGYVDRLGSAGASRLFFVHADHLGRPQKITDATRATVWDGVFAPFGEIHAVTGSIVNVLMFPGQVYDPETGLSQNWHRDYDANIGRYLQSDPIGLEGGISTYDYVSGNPVRWTDFMGLSPTRRYPWDHQHCKALRNKLDSLRKDLADRQADYDRDFLRLPERIGPGEGLRDTLRGHRTEMRKRESSIKKNEERLKNECDGPPCTNCAGATVIVGGALICLVCIAQPELCLIGAGGAAVGVVAQ